MTRTSAPSGPRLPELDSLRGLAALVVVLFHFTTRYQQMYGHSAPPTLSLPWGHHGVSLFFAISGFVIFVTLDRSRSLADFVLSRASRLYPAYWTAILLTTLVVLAAGRTDLLQPPGGILVNLTMLHVYVFVDSVDGAYWTLSVELAFYAVMALLWRGGLFRHIDAVLLAWLSLPWIWTFAPRLTGHEPSWLLGTLLIQSQVAWFAIGIAAYRLRGGARRPFWIIAAAWATIAACDGITALAVALPVTLLIVGVALRGTALLRWPPFVWLGTISYSLYLLHQNIGHVLIGILEGRGVGPDAAILAAIAVVLLLAAAVTYGIERPALRAIRSRWARHLNRAGAPPRPASAPARPSSPGN